MDTQRVRCGRTMALVLLYGALSAPAGGARCGQSPATPPPVGVAGAPQTAAGTAQNALPDPLANQLQQSVLAVVRAHPGVTLAICIKTFDGAFDAQDVRAAVRVLASRNQLRLRSVVDQIGLDMVGNVKLFPVGAVRGPVSDTPDVEFIIHPAAPQRGVAARRGRLRARAPRGGR